MTQTNTYKESQAAARYVQFYKTSVLTEKHLFLNR